MALIDLGSRRKWFNRAFLPALDKALKEGKLNKTQYERLLKPLEKYRFDYK